MIIKSKFKISEICHENFVKISEDFNPLHICTNYAINSGFERKVVHGINILLKILDLLESQKNVIYNSLYIEFTKPIYVGDELDIEFDFRTTKVLIIVAVNTQKCCYITLYKGNYEILENLNSKNVRKKLKPNVLSIKDKVDEKTFFRKNEFLENSFKILQKKYGKHRLYSIVCLSKLVGMHYPGEFGLFKSCRINFTNNKNDLKFSIESRDFRFGLVKLTVNGLGINCKIESFFRKKLNFFVSKIPLKSQEFSVQQSLVIGGSQGIGAIFSQVLLLGGARVTSTYLNNKKFIDKISRNHKISENKLKITKFNILNDLDTLEKYKRKINSIYIFATPKIFREKNEFFSDFLYEEFKKFYVEPIIKICKIFKNSKLGIFLPSSEMVSSPIPNCEEYILSKKLLEKTGRQINRKYSNIRIFTPRLGRVLTRQTNKINISSNIDIKKYSLNYCLKINNFLTND